MTCIRYLDKAFHKASRDMLAAINVVLAEYQAQGFVLTARQLYYQLVARALVPENTQSQYKKICKLVSDGRLAGLIDWDLIEDRGRVFCERQRWTSPARILDAVAASYHEDMWTDQDTRPFVVVEKDALSGILEPVCRALDVPLLAAKGFSSTSAFHEFALAKLTPALRAGQRVRVLHLADHDPSGIDMTRDLRARLALFTGAEVQVIRLALNIGQVREFRPPPNFAKDTDTRTPTYVRQFGSECWELDALQPMYLAQLVRDEVQSLIEEGAWDERAAYIDAKRQRLHEFALEWTDD